MCAKVWHERGMGGGARCEIARGSNLLHAGRELCPGHGRIRDTAARLHNGSALRCGIPSQH